MRPHFPRRLTHHASCTTSHQVVRLNNLNATAHSLGTPLHNIEGREECGFWLCDEYQTSAPAHNQENLESDFMQLRTTYALQ